MKKYVKGNRYMLREMIGEDSKLMVEAAPRAQKCTQEE
jgi:hypothetical protein